MPKLMQHARCTPCYMNELRISAFIFSAQKIIFLIGEPYSIIQRVIFPQATLVVSHLAQSIGDNRVVRQRRPEIFSPDTATVIGIKTGIDQKGLTVGR